MVFQEEMLDSVIQQIGSERTLFLTSRNPGKHKNQRHFTALLLRSVQEETLSTSKGDGPKAA